MDSVCQIPLFMYSLQESGKELGSIEAFCGAKLFWVIAYYGCLVNVSSLDGEVNTVLSVQLGY